MSVLFYASKGLVGKLPDFKNFRIVYRGPCRAVAATERPTTSAARGAPSRACARPQSGVAAVAAAPPTSATPPTCRGGRAKSATAAAAVGPSAATNGAPPEAFPRTLQHRDREQRK